MQRSVHALKRCQIAPRRVGATGVVGMLPDTRMPLGLDLMGGIDLTLQVELDEALPGPNGTNLYRTSAKNEKSAMNL